MSSIPPDYPHMDIGQATDGLSVSQAAAYLGLSVNAVRHKIRRGTLPAVKVNGEWRVQVLEGMPPRPAASPRIGGAADMLKDSPADTPPAYPLSAQRQLEVIRDTLLIPLIEQNERQQMRIAELEHGHGRLEAERDQARIQAEMAALEREQIQAERDALEARLSVLEAAHVEVPQSQPDAPQTQPQRVWWAFWRR